MKILQNTPGRVAIFGCLLVLVLWALCVTGNLSLTMDDLSALFTGLGFVGVVAAFLHEREQSEDANLEHAELIRALQGQSKATLHAARIAALTARLEYVETRLRGFNITGGTVGDAAERRREILFDERELLGKELKKAHEYIPNV